MKFFKKIVLFLLFFPGIVIADVKSILKEEQFDLVPDEETAIKIAEAVSSARFGSSLVLKYRPYKAELKNNIWFISGTALNQESRGGGMPEVEISKTNGKILNLYLSR